MKSKPRNGSPPANEWGKLRSHLAHMGVKQKTIKEVIGDNVNGRKRGEICDVLRAWMKELPKGR